MRNAIDGTMKVAGRSWVLNRWVFWTTLGILLAASGLGPAATAQESPEDPTTSVMMAPYSRSEANGNAVADHQTGLLAIGGAAAQGTGTWGVAWIEMDHVLAQDAEAIEYEVALDRSVAYGWGASVSSWAWALSSSGQYDLDYAPGTIEETGPITLSLRLENAEGPVPAGAVKIRVGLSGSGQGCAVRYPIGSYDDCLDAIWWKWAAWMIAEGTVRSITATVYPASPSEPPNTPPTASFRHDCTDLDCSFDAAGSSDADGSIVGYAWDFGDGATATGVATNHAYAAEGTYTVSLTVTDDEGATDDASEDVSVPDGQEPPPPEIHLGAHGYKEQGLQKADLAWTNATSASIDVVRDDVVIATTENDGAFTDHIDRRGQGSYVYQVCEAGTATCSNEAVVEF